MHHSTVVSSEYIAEKNADVLYIIDRNSVAMTSEVSKISAMLSKEFPGLDATEKTIY